MKQRRWTRAIAIAIAAASTMIGPPAVAADTAPEQPSLIASFEGGWLRLADGWGEARACTYDGVDARCYRTEAEMDAAERPEPIDPSARADCALPTLKLYRNSSYGGSVFQITTRGVYIDLGPAGFSNDTESYKIGPCAARFYDTWPNSGLYPGSTNAGVWSPTMSSGWNNRVSSVYVT